VGPQTPLGNLTTLPQTSYLYLGGLLLKGGERRKGQGNGTEGMGGERRRVEGKVAVRPLP